VEAALWAADGASVHEEGVGIHLDDLRFAGLEGYVLTEVP
jgi:hypothetical protein